LAAVGDGGSVVPAAKYTSYAVAPLPAVHDRFVLTGTLVLPLPGNGFVAFPGGGGGAAVVKLHVSPVVVPAEFFASTRHLYNELVDITPGEYDVVGVFEATFVSGAGSFAK
jgi:hypothetical protein